MKNAILAKEGTIPPPGYILVQTEDGKSFWVHPDSLKPGDIKTTLTREQIRRVKAFRIILRDLVDTSLDEMVQDFSRDQNPEKEIRVFEKIAAIFEQELIDRPNAKKPERQLLFRSLLACSYSANLHDVLSTAPAVKGLKDLERVVKRFNEE